MTTIHTVKTSFKKVFNGTETHLERFRNLVIHINRLTIHVTHFTKWYLLNCPKNQQVLLDKTSFKVMLILMNSSRTSNTQKITMGNTL